MYKRNAVSGANKLPSVKLAPYVSKNEIFVTVPNAFLRIPLLNSQITKRSSQMLTQNDDHRMR